MTLAIHHIVLRIGWIFKTESVIMPAFMDAIAGAGWLRGLLPVLNRVGQSVPPILVSKQLRNAPRKKWILLISTSAMSIPFAIISGIWITCDRSNLDWLPPVFLVLYFLFFSITGVSQLSFGTLEGKLIRPERRGRLMAIAGIAGSVLAISAALLLMRGWLAREDGGFAHVFGFTAGGFLVAAALVAIVHEPPQVPPQRSDDDEPHPSLRQLATSNPQFVMLAVVGMLFVTAQLLFPHYQALGRERPDWSRMKLMVWVVAQNAGAGFWAVLAGTLADRFGNRLALRMELIIAVITPLAALVLTEVWNQFPIYWMTFFLLGTVPTCFKTLANYTLELTDPVEHPRYLSLLRLSMAVPFVLSPFVGALIDWFGFAPVFQSIAAVLVVATLLTWKLHEPRHAQFP